MEEKPYDPTLAEKAFLSTREKGEGDLYQLYKRILENRKYPEEKETLEKALLAKLEVTAPSIEHTNLCKAYRKKIWEEIITEEERALYSELLTEADEINYERIKILIELADLKQISIQTLIKMKEVKVPVYLYEDREQY